MSLARRIWRECLWQFATKTLLVLFAAKARVRMVVYHDLPKRYGFILASNHISHFDPPLITLFFPRRIDWIAMSDLFRGRILRRLFSDLNSIPIERNEPDRAALRIAVGRLSEGRVVGIFPEGGIRDGAASIVNGAEMKQGVSLLFALSGAPVVPCVILGSDRLYNPRNWLPWRRPQIWIGCGKPILPLGDLAGEQKKTYVREQFGPAIVKLKERLCEDFGLTEADLPKPPRQRMREP
ncbi:MAG TPA: lysophospholipid acyltransferase family protein [Terrimicrobiaceae bacterium]